MWLMTGTYARRDLGPVGKAPLHLSAANPFVAFVDVEEDDLGCYLRWTLLHW